MIETRSRCWQYYEIFSGENQQLSLSSFCAHRRRRSHWPHSILFFFFFLKKTNNEQTDVSFLFYFFLSFFCQQQSVLRMSMQVRKRNLAFTHRTVWTLESINESHENEFTHIIISSHIIVISFAHFFFRSFCVLLP